MIAIADRMPDIGKAFYETGPAVGIARLADYLRAQNEAGVLAVDDCEIAAAQFMDACQSTLFKPVLSISAGPPTRADPLRRAASRCGCSWRPIACAERLLPATRRVLQALL